MKLREAIYTRRSVRNYTDEAVDGETVQALLEAAIQAPSALNLQPWAFVVVQNKGLLRELSDQAKALLTDVVAHPEYPAELRRMVSDPEFNIFYNSGTLIVICARPHGEHPDWDCCLAAENLMLMAHGLGLGTCPIGLAWPLLAQPDVRKQLQIPDDCTPVLPIIVGRPGHPAAFVERKKPEILSWK